ncbi:MAG: histidinol-phosphate transaminase [Candidatus Hydrothermarchaeota archaeon]
MKIDSFVKDGVKGLKKAIHGGDVWDYYKKNLIDFSSNINPLGPSKKALEKIKESLWKCAYYPDLESRELKSALADYTNMGYENITVGNGGTELIKNFLEVFLDKGNDVLILSPTFSEYEVFSRLYGGNIRYLFARRENDFEFNHGEIMEKINENTRVIFICNPNNPTGKSLGEKDLLKIIEESYRNDTFVFLDEAYIDFTEMKSFCSKVGDFENLFILRSLTKFFSIPGLRIGFGIGNKKVMEYMEKIRMPWNTNILGEIAAIESIKDKEYIKDTKDTIKREKNFFYKEVSKIDNLKIYSSDANFFLIDLRESGINAREMKNALIKKGMLIRDCSSFRGLDDYFIRIGIRTREENLKLIEEMRSILESIG